MKVAPDHSPALALVAPFFVAAPIGAIVAGLLAARAGHEVFVAINTPRLVAITHALVLGWIGTTIMGATYQLGSAVLQGRLLSARLLALQFAMHAVSVPLFVWAVSRWDTMTMGWAASLLATSLLLFVANAGVLVARSSVDGLPRRYLAAALGFVVLAGVFGVTWVGAIEHGWFPLTPGKLAAHAHLGLVGWIGLTLMGVSYQLVPMFTISPRARPLFGTVALVITTSATLMFAGAMLSDPPVLLRVPLVAFLAAGPLLWSVDQWRTLRARSRRRLDVHGLGTMASLGFLWLAVALGLGAAIGTPFTADSEPARWPLAYGAAAILGWAGTAVLANAIKIHAFLVWLHRHRHRAGREPVPLVADLYFESIARGALAVHVLATLLFVTAALLGALPLFRLAGLLLAGAATGALGTLLWMYVPVSESRRRRPVARGVAR
jgi:hypothetical protein